MTFITLAGDTTRRGFYDYKESGEQINSVQVKEYIEKSRQLAELNGSSNVSSSI
jgi:hypothetical protein